MSNYLWNYNKYTTKRTKYPCGYHICRRGFIIPPREYSQHQLHAGQIDPISSSSLHRGGILILTQNGLQRPLLTKSVMLSEKRMRPITFADKKSISLVV